MIKERLEVIRKKIDAYARDAVAREVKAQMQNLTRDYLKPIAEDFLARSLEAYLKSHLKSSLEDVLGGLEDVFDVPEGAALAPEEEPADIFGREAQKDVGPEDDAMRLLAFLQWFQVTNNTDQIPRQMMIKKELGIGSLEVMSLYNDLRERGFIDGPHKSGRYSKIEILKPLEDPERLLL